MRLSRMPIPELPESIISDLLELFRLDSKTKNQILEGLENVRPAMGTTGLIKQLSDKVDLSEEDVERHVDTLFHIFVIHDISRENVRDLSEAVVSQVQRYVGGKSEDLLGTDQVGEVKQFLIRVLTGEGVLGISVKASRLITENEHTFRDANVYSDMRGIFQADPSVPPEAGVIIHSLKVSHYRSRERKEFYVALDIADLEKLKDVVDRAIMKHKSLKSSLQAAGIAIIDPSRS